MMKYKLLPCVAFTKEDMKLEAMNGEISKLLKNKSLSADAKMEFYEDLLAKIKNYKQDTEGAKAPPPATVSIATNTDPPQLPTLPGPKPPKSPRKPGIPRPVAKKKTVEKPSLAPLPINRTIAKRVTPSAAPAPPRVIAPPRTIAPRPGIIVRSPVLTRGRAGPQGGNGIIRKKKWRFV